MGSRAQAEDHNPCHSQEVEEDRRTLGRSLAPHQEYQESHEAHLVPRIEADVETGLEDLGDRTVAVEDMEAVVHGIDSGWDVVVEAELVGVG